MNDLEKTVIENKKDIEKQTKDINEMKKDISDMKNDIKGLNELTNSVGQLVTEMKHDREINNENRNDIKEIKETINDMKLEPLNQFKEMKNKIIMIVITIIVTSFVVLVLTKLGLYFK